MNFLSNCSQVNVSSCWLFFLVQYLRASISWFYTERSVTFEYLQLPFLQKDSLQVPWREAQEPDSVFGDAGGIFLHGIMVQVCCPFLFCFFCLGFLCVMMFGLVLCVFFFSLFCLWCVCGVCVWYFFNTGSGRRPGHTHRLPLPQTLKVTQLTFENARKVFRCSLSQCHISLGLFSSALSIYVCMLLEASVRWGCQQNVAEVLQPALGPGVRQ